MSGCSTDPLHISDTSTVRAAIQETGVDEASIKFQGCQQVAFSVVLAASTPSQRFIIFYPVMPGWTTSVYITPVLHELGHVVQLRAYGDLTAMRRSLGGSSERIELGADFLAGYISRNYLRGIQPRDFAESLQLRGDYVRRSHSTPEGRIQAFRIGYFLQPNGASLTELHSLFQADYYGSIIANGPSH